MSNCTTLFGASSESRGRSCLMERGTLVCCTSTSHADIIPGEVHHNGSLAWTGPYHPLNLLANISDSSACLFTMQTLSLKDQKKKNPPLLFFFFSQKRNAMGHVYICCLPIKKHCREPHKSLSCTESVASLMLSLQLQIFFRAYNFFMAITWTWKQRQSSLDKI